MILQRLLKMKTVCLWKQNSVFIYLHKLLILKKKLFLFILIFGLSFSNSSYSQKGDVEIFFKNGEVVYGEGKLKGDKWINFKGHNKEQYIKISFDSIDKAKMKIDDSIITFRLYSIIKKNKKQKKPLVLGEFVKGNVNLFLKGEDLANKGMTHTWYFPSNNMTTTFNYMTTISIPHFFINKKGDKNVIHIGAIDHGYSALSNLEDVFNKCPDLYIRIMDNNRGYFKYIKDVIEYYNKKCY